MNTYKKSLLIGAASLTVLLSGCALETKQEAELRLHGKSANAAESAAANQPAAGKLTSIQFYVPSEKENRISVIDVVSSKVVGNIPVSESPSTVIFSSTMREAYAANMHSSTISIINTQTLSVVKEVPVGPMPHGMVLSPDNKTLYVAAVADQFVYLVDTKEGKEAGTIDLGTGAKTNYLALLGDKLYISDHENHKVYIVNVKTKTVEHTIATGKIPRAGKVSDDGKTLYVPVAGDRALEIYNTADGKLLGKIDAIDGATDVVVTDNGQTAIVTGMEGSSVTFVDLQSYKAVKTLTGLPGAKHISFNRQQTKAYVTLSGSNQVAVIDTEKQEVTDRITVGAQPHGIQLKALPGIGGSC
ncbi:hypothetical protein [Paenibacillus solanacearum]|nr:hypothetical protein [Paenibacillus solanacearum]